MFPKRRIVIDSRDREILRLLHNARRPMSGFQIAKRINLSPPAIRPRLNNLRSMGIVKPVKQFGMRSFQRQFSNKKITIKAPSKILWGLDLKKKKK